MRTIFAIQDVKKIITQYQYLHIINLDLIFFLFLKGFRPTVWETTDISIGGKNPTNVNFVIIKNQVRFIDTVKYFQQSLGSLAASKTNDERENVKKKL